MTTIEAKTKGTKTAYAVIGHAVKELMRAAGFSRLEDVLLIMQARKNDDGSLVIYTTDDCMGRIVAQAVEKKFPKASIKVEET